MKRLFLLMCILLICMNGCFENKDEPENPFRIKTATAELYDQDTIVIQYHYDEQGFILQEDQITNGECDCTTYYEYDAWGNTVCETTVYADGSERKVEHFYILDEENRIIYKENYSDTELTDLLEITYDKKGNQIEQISTIVRQGKDQIINSQMSYDRQGNLIKREIRWSNDPSKGGTTLYSYENNRLAREESQAPAGWIKSYIEYSYDNSGLIQTAMEYNGYGSLQSKTIITHDEYENVLRYEYYSHTGRIPGSGDEIADRVVTNTYEIFDLKG